MSVLLLRDFYTSLYIFLLANDELAGNKGVVRSFMGMS